jgi:predicted NUDIX family phosphoesterase
MLIDSTLKFKLKKKYGTEEVFVVPRDTLGKTNDKFTPRNKSMDYTQLQSKGRFILRSDAEYNAALMQVIPYILVLDSTGTKLYVSRRKAGEERLQGKLSFFGGHINPCDFNSNIVLTAAERELSEEVKHQKAAGSGLSFIGYVKDESSATSEHFGVVFSTSVNWAKINEEDNLSGSWMTFQEIFVNYGSFESWAKYIIDQIFLWRKEGHKMLLPMGEEGGIYCD